MYILMIAIITKYTSNSLKLLLQAISININYRN